MTGALLNLVCNNGSQNLWLNMNPEITFFKKIYRRHTPFAKETIPVPLKNNINFGKSTKIILPVLGDLIHRIFFVCDLPILKAMFLNTKEMDILKIIKNANISDKKIAKKIENIIDDSNNIETIYLINLINETLQSYEKKKVELKLLDQEDYVNSFLSIKKEYYLIYHFVKSIKEHMQPIIKITTLTRNFSDTFYTSIFTDLIGDKEILAFLWIQNLTVGQSVLPLDENIYNILKSQSDQLDNNITYYQNIVKLYQPMQKYNMTMTDSIKFLLSICQNKNVNDFNQIVNDFSPFGVAYHYIINAYNTVLGVVKTLAKSIPIVSTKVFYFEKKDTKMIDIYSDVMPTALLNHNFMTLMDPNFKMRFILDICDINKYVDAAYGDIDFLINEDSIGLNKYQNAYLLLYNDKANNLFDLLQFMMDKLYISYQPFLFSSTKTLFYDNIPPLNHIYSYITPNIGFRDQMEKRIYNVMNINIWFFYFFKYLDKFDESKYVNYVNLNIMSLNVNEKMLLKNIITLLKINLSYYMHEISYLMNDLYQNNPSNDPKDTMKNYVPPSFNERMENVNIHSDLIAITFIFHRNLIPTILEMFQYIYYFVDNIAIANINKYLKIKIHETENEKQIRKIIKILYYNIFAYFTEKYDAQKFEEPMNYTLHEYGNWGLIIRKYVNHFLIESPQSIGEDQNQLSLKNNIMQMEFYFIAEFLHMREMQKFYHNVLFNRTLLTEKVGSTTTALIDMMNQILLNLDHSRINLNEINNHPDASRIYYDRLYQTNVEDKLYYSTFNINRYNGKPYLTTSYISRNYGIVPKIPTVFDPDYVKNSSSTLAPPIPIPQSDPYGLNPEYYDNNQNNFLYNEISVFWLNNTHTNLKNNYNYSHYQLFELDYFRIKHSIFYQPNKSFKVVDPYQLYLLKVLNNLESILRIYPKPDFYLTYWINLSLAYLIRNTDTHVYYDSAQLYDFSKDPSVTNVLKTLYFYFNLNDTALIPLTLIKEAIHMFHGLIKRTDEGEPIKLCSVLNEYTFQDLGNINCDTCIINNIRLMRNNFINYYYYYVKHINAFNKLYQQSKNDITFQFKNNFQQSQMLIEDYHIKEIPSNIFLFPYSYVHELQKIREMETNLTDIDRYLLSEKEPLKKLTHKDILDIVNIQFDAMIYIFEYVVHHDQYDYIMKHLDRYQKMLIEKNKFENYILSNLFTDNLDFHHINNILKYAQNFGLELVSYLNDILFTLLDHSSNFQKILLFKNLNLDYYFLKFYFNVDSMLPIKNYLINEIFSDTFSRDHKLLLKYFNLIDNTYFYYLHYFMDYAKMYAIIKNPLSLTDISITNLSEFLDSLIHSILYENMEHTIDEELMITEKYYQELLKIKNQISAVLYRNKNAKCAWVRKLAHFLIKEITIKANDQIIDLHISDWLECFHEISKKSGLEYGYNKMIGNLEKLTNFDETTKDKQTIALPFVFYFNRNIFSALPLTASLHTNYECTITLRSLEEVAYKQKWSNYVDVDGVLSIPKLSNVHLMVEYIYLSSEERKIFAVNQLEYLIDEIQIDISSNYKMIPVYKIKDRKELIDANQLDLLNYKPTLQPRDNLVDPNIWYQKIDQKYNFQNLVKYLIIVAKPLIHTNLYYRNDQDNYFDGEHQWDNYGLHSYYNLSKIYRAQEDFYNQFSQEINNLSNKIFGFLPLINNLILETDDNLELEVLHLIKDNLGNIKKIHNLHNLVRLKENLLSLSINFNIVDIDTVLSFYEKIITLSGLPRIPSQDILMLYNVANVNLEKDKFKEILSHHFVNFTDIFENLYREYNESKINQLVKDVRDSIDYDVEYNFLNAMLKIHQTTTSNNIINEIMLKTNIFQENSVKNIVFKNIIYQLVPLDKNIPYAIINNIAKRLNYMYNDRINNYHVDIINYQKNLIEQPKINPITFISLKINNTDLLPALSSNFLDIHAYLYANHTPNTGINLYSWSLDPLSHQPSGTINLSRIDSFIASFYVNLLISEKYPIEIVSMAFTINFMRYLSGMCGKTW